MSVGSLGPCFYLSLPPSLSLPPPSASPLPLSLFLLPQPLLSPSLSSSSLSLSSPPPPPRVRLRTVFGRVLCSDRWDKLLEPLNDTVALEEEEHDGPATHERDADLPFLGVFLIDDLLLQ